MGKEKEYRAFIFAIHETHGILLLHCTRKPKKGPHFQLPGGHIDEDEFVVSAGDSDDGADKEAKLIAAARRAAAREFFEETGIDLTDDGDDGIDRLLPVKLHDDKKKLGCEVKERLFFKLMLTDDDFFSREQLKAENISNYTSPLGDKDIDLMLKLSEEHSGFTFEKSFDAAAELIEKHSGGVPTQALLMMIERQKNEQQKQQLEFHNADENNSNDDDMTITTWDDSKTGVADKTNDDQHFNEQEHVVTSLSSTTTTTNTAASSAISQVTSASVTPYDVNSLLIGWLVTIVVSLMMGYRLGLRRSEKRYRQLQKEIELEEQEQMALNRQF